jgi:hypothetical protein
MASWMLAQEWCLQLLGRRRFESQRRFQPGGSPPVSKSCWRSATFHVVFTLPQELSLLAL